MTKNWKLVLGGVIIGLMYSVEVINGCPRHHHISRHPKRPRDDPGCAVCNPAYGPDVPAGETEGTSFNIFHNLCLILIFASKRYQ